MKNLTIINKIAIFSGLFFILICTRLVVLNNIINVLNDDVTMNMDKTYPITENYHQLQTSVIQTQQWLTDISATRALDGLDDGFAEAENAAKMFAQAIKNLSKLDAENSSRYQSLLPIFSNYYQVGQKMAHSYIDQGPQGGNKVMAEFDETAVAINSKVDEFVQEFKLKNIEYLADQIADAKLLTKINYIFDFAYLVLLLTMIYGAVVFITRPTKKLAHSLRFIADGDFTHTIQVDSLDEIGEIAESANKIVSDLGSVLRRVSDDGKLIHDHSKESNQVIDDTAKGVEQQKVLASAIIEAMPKMNGSVEKISSLSIQAQDKASSANNEAHSGKDIVDSNINSINVLSSDIQQVQESISALEKSSEEIGSVLAVIQAIAEQTNLLALNAAIEAARAGEQGRGFAVVADEVRTLAARTQDSAQEIKTMIDALQAGTKQAATMMDKSLTQVKSTVLESEKAGSSLETIFGSVEDINQINDLIADATKDQTLISEEVNEKINKIVNLIEEVTQKSSLANDMGSKTQAQTLEFTKLISNLKL